MSAFGFSSHVISDLSEYDAEVFLSLAIIAPQKTYICNLKKKYMCELENE